jgi:hypothetical protein
MQNPAWSEEDTKMLKWLCRIVHSQKVGKVITLKEESELGKWMDKQLNHNPQPHWDWSEKIAREEVIAEVCEWIDVNYVRYLDVSAKGTLTANIRQFITDLKQAMKDE